MRFEIQPFHVRGCHTLRLAALATALVLVFAAPAEAVQVQDLVRIKGSESNQLVGMGLVVGLNGTGDGGEFLPAMRPLASAIQKLIDPGVVAAELEDAENVALVSLSVRIPAAGVREGDRVDVYVSAIGSAESLRGGRLFLVPLTGPVPNSPIFAYAEGPVVIEDAEHPTVGVIRKGAQLTRDIMARHLDRYGRLTLVIHEENATWSVAKNLAALINGELSPDEPIAYALDAKNVVVQTPPADRHRPAPFIARVMETYIDPSQVTPGATVVINERTGTIIISGDVQISPVVITQRGLTISTLPGGEAAAPDDEPQRQPFAAIDPERRGGAKLTDLLEAFNQLKVPVEDRIAVLREMKRAGHLHAKLIIE